jgi:uncharacterized phage protein gp47/JayE
MSSSDYGLQITPSGITISDTSEVRERIVAGFKTIWGNDLDVSPETPQGQLIDSITAIIDDKNAQLMFTLNQFDPEKNEGIWQEGIGKIYFITRKQGARTTVPCLITGIVGTTLPAGAKAMDRMGRIYELVDALEITVPSPIEATFAATEPGPVQCPRNTLDRIYKRINGWDTINNPDAGIPGTYPEARIEFERRRELCVAKNAHGNYEALYGAISDIPDVISVGLAENTDDEPRQMRGVTVPAHGFFISVVGGSNQDIAKVIYERKDGGSSLGGNTLEYVDVMQRVPGKIYRAPIRFNRPAMVPYDVRVMVKIYGAHQSTDLQSVLKQRVLDTSNGLYGEGALDIGDSVFASRFICPLNALKGPYRFDIIRVDVRRRAAEAVPVTDSFWELDGDTGKLKPRETVIDAVNPFFKLVEVDGKTYWTPVLKPGDIDPNSSYFRKSGGDYVQIRPDLPYTPGATEWGESFDTTLNEYPYTALEFIGIEFYTEE